MKFTFIRTIIFIWLANFLISSALADASTNVPTALTARIGGFLGTSYSVNWQNGALNYSASKEDKTIDSAKIIPSPAQWNEFRKTLNRLNVWKWHYNYDNTNILDGTQWSLEITYVDCSLKTDGSNCYPEANGKPNKDPMGSKEFDEYLRAVEKLLGGKKFK
jgi:hypothetical protein